VKIDPRVKTFIEYLQLQHDLSLVCYEDRKRCMEIINKMRAYRQKIKEKLPDATGNAITTLNDLDKQASLLETPPTNTEPSFNRLNGTFASVFGTLQEADVQPTSQAV